GTLGGLLCCFGFFFFLGGGFSGVASLSPLAGVARGTFTVTAWPRVAVVAFGGSTTVNCSRSACPGGNASLELHTPLAATPGPGGLRWQSFRLLNVSRWSPGPATCAGTCGDTRAEASADVLVYQLPERVALDPVAPVAVGDSRNVTCRVLEVAPVGNLTVTLRRGGDTLRTQSFGSAPGSASVAVTHLLTATPGDHGQDVTCHAELSLRPHGPLFARAAAPVTLSVFALPEPLQLEAPSLLEVGATSRARCRVAGAFPAGDTRVTLALGRETLNASLEVAGDAVTAVTELSPSQPGLEDITCTAAVASATRTARRTLHVYRFPAPTLELLPQPAEEGAEVTMTCQAGDTEPAGPPLLQLLGSHGEGVLAEGPRSRVERRVVARREDDGRELRCRASLAVGDSAVTKEAATRLLVHYPPEFGAGGCPANRTWVRGAWESLWCRATGNPAPAVACARAGVPVGTGEPEPVTRERAGTYECTATNALGTSSRSVAVRVECEWHPGWHWGGGTGGVTLVTPGVALWRHGGHHGGGTGNGTGDGDEPTLSDRGCPSRRVWVEGQRRDLQCRAEGDPPPSTRCARHGDTPGDAPRARPTRARGTRVVSRADAGRYLCRATNRHGVATRDVVVTVEYQPSIPERGCPERRLWLEGTPARLGCAATGNPPPRVTCTKLGDGQDHPLVTPNATHPEPGDAWDHPLVTAEDGGDTWDHPLVTPNVTRTELGGTWDHLLVAPDVTWTKLGDTQDTPVTPNVTWTEHGDPQDPPVTPNVTQTEVGDPQDPPRVSRAHAGTYQCRASNAHGSAVRNVTVAVEFGPSSVTLRAVPSSSVPRGGSFSLDCGAEGVPSPAFAWAVPVAPNLRLGPDNRSVTVTAATAANRGLYTCTASNRHGRRARSVLVSVDETWLVALVALGSLGAVALVALLVAGGLYLKSTACKKGEYNVRDAEGSSGASCPLHRHRHRQDQGDIFGIQLSPP
ncbi:intercellular adhesion molecule 5, partial [Empidonax traillii]|uniref:intercellular adhesion molecule 5 n=1 Tax=Empidonax traillii TaxID=164674 RepID=UPI000FFD24E3